MEVSAWWSARSQQEGWGSLNVHSQVWPLAVMNERNLGTDVGFGLFGCWILSVSLHYEPAKTTPESKVSSQAETVCLFSQLKLNITRAPVFKLQFQL